jgi:uncharacterized membrane protein
VVRVRDLAAARLKALPANVESVRASSSDRWLALDVFRALAVLWMIQGHTFTALLQPAFIRGAWLQPYSLLHGLTAPMFLIGAGLSYGVVMFGTAGSDSPGSQRDRARSRRILRRALQLLAIGTLLQLPRTSLVEVFARRDLFIGCIQPGALQLVASGLLIAEGVRRWTRTRLGFARAAAGMFVAIGLAAPWIWNARTSETLVAGSWLDGQHGSQFPLVPWLCFFFLGAALAGAYARRLWLHGDPPPQRRRLMPIFGLVGFACSALCYGLFLSGVRFAALYGAHSFWYSNPLFIVFRAGLACAWLGVLTASETLLVRAFAALPWFARVIRVLAKHSLVAYVVHLVLLYGTPWNAGLARSGAIFDFAETSAALACVLSVTVAATFAWERWQGSGGLRERLSAWRAQPSDAPRS